MVKGHRLSSPVMINCFELLEHAVQCQQCLAMSFVKVVSRLSETDSAVLLKYVP